MEVEALATRKWMSLSIKSSVKVLALEAFSIKLWALGLGLHTGLKACLYVYPRENLNILRAIRA